MHCPPRKLCIEIGTKDELFNAEYGVKSFERLKAICKEVGTDWVKFITFEGTHEFCKDDEPIEALIKDIIDFTRKVKFMKNKVILISIDGMRPDGMKNCGNPYVSELEKMAAYSYTANSVRPTVTFPCHFSMAHSVKPERHGILTNTYVPEVRPITGLFERIRMFGGKTAMFYSWEPMRDISRPEALCFSTYINLHMEESVDTALTDEAIRVVGKYKPDFVFLYLGKTDNVGHDYGWMTKEYLERINIAIDNVKRMIESFGEEYSVIIMADHGGHDRCHGDGRPEDFTIPLFFIGQSFTPGVIIEQLTLLDIAPTVAKVMGFEPVAEWEGKAIF